MKGFVKCEKKSSQQGNIELATVTNFSNLKDIKFKILSSSFYAENSKNVLLELDCFV